MKVGGFFGIVARASKDALTRGLGSHPNDKHISFIGHRDIPELRTLAAAPDEVHSHALEVIFSHQHRSLHVRVLEKTPVKFVFREEDILVLSDEPFSVPSFRDALSHAIALRQTPRTEGVHQYSPLRG